jgi:hypothetical protein
VNVKILFGTGAQGSRRVNIGPHRGCLKDRVAKAVTVELATFGTSHSMACARVAFGIQNCANGSRLGVLRSKEASAVV